MDMIAINDLRARYIQAVRAAETYREAADAIPSLKEFYDALAFTHEQIARQAILFLNKAEKIARPIELAA